MIAFILALATAPSPGAAERDLLARAEAAAARGSMDEAARAWEEAATRSAGPAPALVRAARARRGLAEQHAIQASDRGAPVGQALESAAREAQVCADDARQAWAWTAPEAAAASRQGRPPADFLALVGQPAAEALYLDAVCAALWARSRGITPLLERNVELRAYLERTAQLAPQLDEAGPDRELGWLLAALPAYAGGDLDAARRHFEKALARAPAPRTRLLYAGSVAVKAQDRALFEAQLRPVVDGKGELADKARALLQRADELFGK